MKLLSQSQYKMEKSGGQGYAPAILHLQPYKFMGKNTCPKAGGCATVCLQYTGMMVFTPSIVARQTRTAFFWNNREGFLTQLSKEIASHRKAAIKKGLKPCIRLNGTSDIQWERVAPKLFTEFSDVQFYDYTKIATRFDRELPANYHLTFSQAEDNMREVDNLRFHNRNVAVVFRVKKDEPLPRTYKGHPVTDGDLHDLRFLDHPGWVVGLRAKGRAYKDKTGFVVDTGG